jgi:hypothetical protein
MKLTIVALVSAGVSAEACDATAQIVRACQANATARALLLDCINTVSTPLLPLTCDADAFKAYTPACVCPYLKANIACTPQYCPSFDMPCFKYLLNSTYFCGPEASAAHMHVPGYNAMLVLAAAALSLVLL